MRPGSSGKEIAPLSFVRGCLHAYIYNTCIHSVYMYNTCIHSGEVLEVSDPYGVDVCMIGREVGEGSLKDELS